MVGELQPKDECDIRVIMAQFTEFYEDADYAWPVFLRAGKHTLLINKEPSIEDANALRYKLASALLEVIKNNHKKERCSDCSKKIRADWY